MIKFSIIVPIYNSSGYLEYCLNSILNQSYKHFELILVNDGSSDNSLNICVNFRSKDNRIILINKENGGAGSARNVGLEKAVGDFIIFCDSDDYWNTSNFLEIVSSTIKKEEPELIIFDYKKLYNNKYEFNIERKWEVIKYKEKEDILNYLMTKKKFTTSANWKVIKKNILIDNNISFLEGTIAEDMDWGMRVYSHSKEIVYIDKKFYFYRQREGSITRSLNEEKINNLWNMIEDCTGKKAEEQDIPIIIIYKYFSFHYFVLLAIIASSKIKNKKQMICILKKKRWLLKYIPNNRLKVISYLRYIIGFNMFVKSIGCILIFKK